MISPSILVLILGINSLSANISTRSYSFQNHRGTKITGVSWLPKTEPLALVYISHGYGEHMGYYHPLGEALANAGLAAFGHDHEGHGISGGERVNIENFQHFVDDLFQDCQSKKQDHQNKNLPMFVFGHSMGGLITLMLVLQKPNYFRGMVLSGPLIQSKNTHGSLNFINQLWESC